MARTRSAESIDEKIANEEEKLRGLKKRCDKICMGLDELYAEKKVMEEKELLSAIERSSRTRAEIIAFLSSKA